MAGRESRLALFVGAVFLFDVNARGELRFDTDQLELIGAPADKTLSGTYFFRNTGTRPVRILGVKTICGCTAVKPDAEVIPAGGRSGIVVSFKTIGRNGVYETPVKVRTDDPQQPEVKLILRTDVRDLILVRPALLFWKSTEARSAKSVMFRSRDEHEIRSLRLLSAPDMLNAKVEELQAGKEYRLVVEPRVVTVEGLQEIVCVAVLSDGSERVIRTKVKLAL